MKKIDRALISWSQGNFSGAFGHVQMNRAHVYINAVPICARLKDHRDKPYILVRDDHDASINPQRHFGGRKWAKVPKDRFDGMLRHIYKIEQARAYVRDHSAHILKSWKKDTLLRQLIEDAGHSLIDLQVLANKSKLDIMVTHEPIAIDPSSFSQSHDPLLVGSIHFFKGLAEALTIRSVGSSLTGSRHRWAGGREAKLYKRFDDAMLYKMKNDEVRLYDLS